MSLRCREQDHEWVEGYGRDHGRWHCAKCHQVLFVQHLLDSHRRVRTALLALATTVRGGAPLTWADPRCQREASEWEKHLEMRLRAADAALKEGTSE